MKDKQYIHSMQALINKRDSLIEKIKYCRAQRRSIGEPDEAYYADSIDVAWVQFETAVDKLEAVQ